MEFVVFKFIFTFVPECFTKHTLCYDMAYLKVFIKSSLQTIFYYLILLSIEIFNFPFLVIFYFRDKTKADKSSEMTFEDTRREEVMERITEY